MEKYAFLPSDRRREIMKIRALINEIENMKTENQWNKKQVL